MNFNSDNNFNGTGTIVMVKFEFYSSVFIGSGN